jgi:hypothetical protein
MADLAARIDALVDVFAGEESARAQARQCIGQMRGLPR